MAKDGRVAKDQRKEKRIKEELRIVIEIPGPAGSPEMTAVNALTRDISLGGARIMTDTFFPVGAVMRMSLFLSRTKQVIKIQADVRWVRAVDTGVFEIGVEFRHGIPLSVMALINHLYGKARQAPAPVQAKNTNAHVN